MARAIILEDGQFVKFKMSNKPEFVFVCDKEDFGILNSCDSWYVHTNKGKGDPYIRRNSPKRDRHIHFHRFIMNAGVFHPSKTVDHVNGNTCDLRKSNLRIITFCENLKSRHRSKSDREIIVNGIGYFWKYVRRNGKILGYTCYHEKKYIGFGKDLEQLKINIKNNLKDPTNGRNRIC